MTEKLQNMEYYLGLTMDTTSVGWAVTDSAYHLLKAKGHDMWGIRGFYEAELADTRRNARSSRRRIDRERVRIEHLMSYFEPAISAVDPQFYARLGCSGLYEEDKSVEGSYSLFNDFDYTDREYYKDYPTIFHLRNELAHDPSPHDVRLVFLALLNMFKHRGHFYATGLGSDTETVPLYNLYQDFCRQVSDLSGIMFPLEISKEGLTSVMAATCGRSEKVVKLCTLLGVDNKGAAGKQKMQFIRALCGMKSDVRKLFPELEVEEEATTDFCFAEASYDEKAPSLEGLIGDYYNIIETMKLIYDAGILYNILGDCDCISQAKVLQYEKHNSDLLCLKRAYKTHKTKNDYDRMFRLMGPGSYSAYVKGSFVGGKRKIKSEKTATREDLYLSIKKDLSEITGSADVDYILNEIDSESFLPKQLTDVNRIIPNQVYVKEMKMILENAGQYLPFLHETDGSGLTVSERIQSLFSFCMPYFVGPASENSKKYGGNGWVVRKEAGQVLPWNLAEKVDLKATSEEFITRMVRHCTYIAGEMVLPKDSLLYENFCVLNEINNIRLNGFRISVELKQELYNTLYKTGKKVSKSALFKFFKAKGLITYKSQLGGLGDDATAYLRSYGLFKEILGERIDEDSYREMADKIIFYGTVYGNSKTFLKEKIKEEYGHVLSDTEIERMSALKFKNWGRLSKEFLTIEACDTSTGECVSLIRTLWDTNFNMMELLYHEKYTFADVIREKQTPLEKTLFELIPEDLDEFYFTAPVKRMVWQALAVVKDIVEIMGHPPKRIFLDTAGRFADRKNDARQRQTHLLNCYNKQSDAWKDLIKDSYKNGTLKSKKVYLYFKQLGRCMYTGEVIDFDALIHESGEWDIDHIYPQHFANDHSLENNLVLVKHRINSEKSDNYPLPAEIRDSQLDWWTELHEMGLVNEEKYNRLVRKTSFTNQELAGFIEKNMNDNSHGTKSVASLLKQVFSDESEVIYTKAANIAVFRQKFNIPKCEELNMNHRAHTAYLNIVVGNCYYVKFTKSPMHFITNEYGKNPGQYHYHLNKMYDRDILRGNDVAWVAQDGELSGTIELVQKVMKRNTPLYTRHSYIGHGAITDLNLINKHETSPDSYLPVKTSDAKLSDVTKYGGYKKMYVAYFFLVEHTDKKCRVRTIEYVPICFRHKIEKTDDGLLNYCIDELHLQDPVVLIRKIALQSLLKINGYYVHLTGRSGTTLMLRNAVPMCLNFDWQFYIRKIAKSVETENLDEAISKRKNIMLYEELLQKHTNSIFSKKPTIMWKKLEKGKESFVNLDLAKQCFVLLEVLKLTQIGPTIANLKDIGLPAKTGVMSIGKKVSSCNEVLLVHQSPTGLHELTVDLLKA